MRTTIRARGFIPGFWPNSLGCQQDRGLAVDYARRIASCGLVIFSTSVIALLSTAAKPGIISPFSL